MKKLIAGTFVVMAIAAVVLDIQYAWKPDTLGQEAKTVQQINYIENPFQSERVFQYLFLKILQNLRKII